ncbi:CK1/CK1 protein kinase [Epithele typhae]|uniref:CK1/CK1 protein kinase n=1 Tax=Epithele typhae TaxID=378194 RepID=UPI002008C98A|nr:CK1/CK1 protein kinase [Epithele typhae]KAH9931666.1 CK1/CK1 protein kinase [Epithele typhae]
MTGQTKQQYPRFIKNWKLGQKLGAGFSGAIFVADHVHTGQRAAIKLQPVDEPTPTNRYERAFYPAMQGGTGIPTLWASGQAGTWDYLVIDLLGRSLDSLHRELMLKQDVWDLRSVCSVAIQTIDRMRWIHSRGILHRDIQLGNFVVGPSPNHETLYMIDFGFSKFYIDPATRRHIPDSKAPRDFIGNYWFSSVRVHCQGRVPSRRDDMEALALMLIHLLTPYGLSWTRNGIPMTNEAHERLKKEKRLARPEDLCHGLPPVFEELLRASRKHDFQGCPDYEYWIEEFRALADEYGFEEIDRFIWPSPCPKVPPKQAAKKKAATAELEGVLQDLAELKLGESSRQALGERPHLVNRGSNGDGKSKDKVKDSMGKKPAAGAAGGSDSDENAPTRGSGAGVGRAKATRLAQLARAAGAASDNRGLAAVLREFTQVMQENRSRTLTKEGFAVLDALHKQLADPSVFVAPAPRRPRASGGGSVGTAGTADSARETRSGKMNKLWRLGVEAKTAGDNGQLARLVSEFGQVIYKSGGRTVTKDGFGFLNALTTRLEALA